MKALGADFGDRGLNEVGATSKLVVTKRSREMAFGDLGAG